MARYGQFKRSDQKYGLAPEFENTLWGIAVNWNEDGLLYVNEADRAIDFSSDRGRSFMINQSGEGIQPLDTGSFQFVLLNQDGRYDPLNASSPIYPDGTPGKQVMVVCRHSSDGTTEPVITGEIMDIMPMGGVREPAVTVLCETRWHSLKGRKVNVPMALDVPTGVAVATILDAAGVTDPQDLDEGDDVIPYFYVESVGAAEQLSELAESEYGALFIAKNGTFTFRRRNRQDADAWEIDQAVLLKDIGGPMPWQIKRDLVEVVSWPAELVENTTFWSYTQNPKPSLGPGQSVVIFAELKFENRPVYSIPDSITAAITANVASDGTGMNMAAYVVSGITQYGGIVRLEISNSHPTQAFVLTSISLAGDAVDIPYKSAFQAGDGYNTFQLDNRFQQTPAKAQQYAYFLLQRFSDYLQLPIIQFENRWNDGQLGIELADRILLTSAKKSINASFRIGRIQHRWLEPNGQGMLTTMQTEPLYDPAVDGSIYDEVYDHVYGY